MDFMGSRTRTLTKPRLTSLGGFKLGSTNFRFCGLGMESNGGVGRRIAGSIARISSGNRSGKRFLLFTLNP